MNLQEAKQLRDNNKEILKGDNKHVECCDCFKIVDKNKSVKASNGAYYCKSCYDFWYSK